MSVKKAIEKLKEAREELKLAEHSGHEMYAVYIDGLEEMILELTDPEDTSD